jgi:hypothetical protein
MIGREVLWRLTDGIGLEHARLTSMPEGHLLAGVVVTTAGAAPVTIDYAVRADRFWHTREVSVSLISSGAELSSRPLHLVSDGDGTWHNADPDTGETIGKAISAIQGCIDVDLAFTPATNTLPIRRFEMAHGARIEVAAAWVQFPSLDLEILNQRYQRLDRSQYRYESPGHQFAAMLVVDNLGLVRTYEGLWERIAESDF